MSKRSLFAGVILGVSFLLILTSGVNSQSYTTMTGTTTMTTTATYTQTSSYPIATYTNTVTSTDTAYANTISMPGISTGSTCRIADTASFQAKAHQHLDGEFHSDHWAVLYILTDSEYKIWSNSNWCSPEDAGTTYEYMKALTVGGVGHVGFDAVYDGTYWVVIEVFETLPTHVSFVATMVVVEDVSTTQMATTNNVVLVTATLEETSFSVSNLQPSVQSTQQSAGISPLILVAVVVIVVVLAGIVLLLRSRAKKP
ncbi:MAG TPA: hypothetical protein VLV18_10510 [Terriglobales bacterium]|nr:hypothetical protein [Terriglobales bacterium]